MENPELPKGAPEGGGGSRRRPAAGPPPPPAYWSEGGMRSVRPEREVSKVSILRGVKIWVGAGFRSARGRIPARAPVRGALGISSQLGAIN